MNKMFILFLSILIFVVSIMNCKDNKSYLAQTGSNSLSSRFQIVEEEKRGPSGKTIWSISIILSESDYSKHNLEEIFRFFSEKYPDQNERLRVYTFTSIAEWEKEKNVPPAIPVMEKDPSAKEQEFNTYAMAIFYRPNISDIKIDGDFIRYFYSPDLATPKVRQKFILIDDTWVNIYP